MVDSKTAIEMIGLELKIHGEKWLERQKNAADFLQGNNITPQQAMEAHTEWKQELFKRLNRDEQGRRLDKDSGSPIPRTPHWNPGKDL